MHAFIIEEYVAYARCEGRMQYGSSSLQFFDVMFEDAVRAAFTRTLNVLHCNCVATFGVVEHSTLP